MRYIYISLLILLFCFPLLANADAWWGKGYKTPQWVLDHGGTIIHYTITSKNPNDYKAIMYKDGKYVEVEFGKNAIFDDAKNGIYNIIFYKCDGSCERHKFDKKSKIRGNDKIISSIKIQARPAETIRLTFDAKNKNIRIISRSGYIRPKTAEEIIIENTYAVRNQLCTLKKYAPQQIQIFPNAQRLKKYYHGDYNKIHPTCSK